MIALAVRTGWLLAAAIVLVASCAYLREPEPAGGYGAGPSPAGVQPIDAPLIVSPRNPRYFQDGAGRTVRLGGHQIHVDLQDHTFNKPFTYGHATRLDWSWYLDFAVRHNFNVLRNWTLWSTGRGYTDAARIAAPMMFARTGPGVANDGRPKFDLTVFDRRFFARLRARAASAQAQGIYVIIMLFDVHAFTGGSQRPGMFTGNVFNAANNINGIDVDGNGDGAGLEFFYTQDARILEIQKNYVRKVVDTVGDLDNVLYEIANEAYALEWQRSMVDWLRELEAGRAKRHLIYMSPGGMTRTGQWKEMTPDDLAAGGADVTGVMSAFGDYAADPPVMPPDRPVIWDNDHVWGDDWTHRRRAWMAFTRGYHFVYYDHPFERPDEATPADELMRRNIGATNRYARRFADLARMQPRGELSSSGFCLADPGAEYLVYAPRAGALDLRLEAGRYRVEWYDCSADRTHDGGVIETGGGEHSLSPPDGVSEDFAVYLRRTG